MSERSEGRVASGAPVMRVPVDPVELETRLAAIERRLAEFEAREQRLLELIQAVNRLTAAVGPLIKPAQPEPEPPPQRQRPDWPLPTLRAGAPGQGGPGPVAPERIALAHARLRETLFAGPPAEQADGPPADDPDARRAQERAAEPVAPSVVAPSPIAAPAASARVAGEPTVAAPPPGRKSWLLRALRRMIKRDPQAAGALLHALPPAHAFAQLAPISEFPGPPEKLAPLLVTGRVRRRIGWEKARLECSPRAVSELVPLVRVRASADQLRRAGVQLNPALAFAVVAFAIEPAWTAGQRFAIAHRGPDRVTYFSVRDRGAPTASAERPSVPVTTTVCCVDEALFPVLCRELPAGVTVLGALAPLELVQRWFARATGGEGRK